MRDGSDETAVLVHREVDDELERREDKSEAEDRVSGHGVVRKKRGDPHPVKSRGIT